MNLLEYSICQYSIYFLLLSEFIIWLFTSSRFTGKREGKPSGFDRGTIWLITLGFCSSIWVSYYFRSRGFIEDLRNLLLPHIFYYIGILLIIGGIFVRDISVWTLKRSFTFYVQTTDNQHLIKTGFYKYIRNPAYLGSIMSLMGMVDGLKRKVFLELLVIELAQGQLKILLDVVLN